MGTNITTLEAISEAITSLSVDDVTMFNLAMNTFQYSLDVLRRCYWEYTTAQEQLDSLDMDDSDLGTVKDMINFLTRLKNDALATAQTQIVQINNICVLADVDAWIDEDTDLIDLCLNAIAL